MAQHTSETFSARPSFRGVGCKLQESHSLFKTHLLKCLYSALFSCKIKIILYLQQQVRLILGVIADVFILANNEPSLTAPLVKGMLEELQPYRKTVRGQGTDHTFGPLHHWMFIYFMDFLASQTETAIGKQNLKIISKASEVFHDLEIEELDLICKAFQISKVFDRNKTRL